MQKTRTNKNRKRKPKSLRTISSVLDHRTKEIDYPNHQIVKYKNTHFLNKPKSVTFNSTPYKKT
jgi:hypothetical protein